MSTFELRLRDGSVAEPGTFTTAVPNWRPGDRIFVSPTVRYRVLEIRERVLVVERE